MEKTISQSRLEKILVKLLGPNAINQEARKRLTDGGTVSVTLYSVDPEKKHYIKVKDGCAHLDVFGVTASVPFVPFDEVDACYFGALIFNDDEIQLPDEKTTNAYFCRFERAGFTTKDDALSEHLDYTGLKTKDVTS